MGASKTNGRSEYEYDKGLTKSRRTRLRKTAETLSSDVGDREQHFPQEERSIYLNQLMGEMKRNPPN